MTIDLAPKRDVMEIALPNNNLGVSVTPANSWAWPASWTQFVSAANMTSDFILCGVAVHELLSTTTATVTNHYQLEVGTGVASSEVTVASFAGAIGYTKSGSSETASILQGVTFRCAPTRLLNGVRVAIRASKSTTDPLVLNVTLIGFDPTHYAQITKLMDDNHYLRGGYDKAIGSIVFPALGTTNVTTSTSWGYGSYVEFVAAAAVAEAMLIVGASSGATTTGGGFHAKVATGTAGQETDHGLIVFSGRVSSPGPGFGFEPMIRPAYIKPGERVAVAIRGKTDSTAFPIQLVGFKLK